MSICKTFFITFAFSMLYVSSATAVPMSIETTGSDLSTTTEAQFAHDNFSEIPLTTQSVSIEPAKDFDLEPPSLHTATHFFRTLLSSLTYEIKFTPLGRLYTATPHALQSQDHPLLSSRLLPHPEMPQSTALVHNTHFGIERNTKAVSPTKQETDRFPTALWFTILFLLLVAAVVAIMWQTRTIIILRI